MLVVVPIVLYRALSNRQLDRAAYHSARVMVVGTIVLSVRLVYLHLTHWYMPDVQKYIVRILWMVRASFVVFVLCCVCVCDCLFVVFAILCSNKRVQRKTMATIIYFARLLSYVSFFLSFIIP